MRNLIISQSQLKLPLFMPDATFGLVKGVSSDDLRQVGIQALVMNAFHLMQKPGTSTVQALG
ncbi:MAG: queuine tRNA-ribosyltransferase family protein, partial [Anaerolineaceae bacterium]|nr:queuine tRNA-ribosyltransferase family protein [Anaerolineaceae bacterium]